MALPLLPDAFPGLATAGFMTLFLFDSYVVVSTVHLISPVAFIKLATLSRRVDAGISAP